MQRILTFPFCLVLVHSCQQEELVVATQDVSVGNNFQGGIVAYILTPEDPRYDPNVQHGLIAASNDVNQCRWWNSSCIITGEIELIN